MSDKSDPASDSSMGEPALGTIMVHTDVPPSRGRTADATDNPTADEYARGSELTDLTPTQSAVIRSVRLFFAAITCRGVYLDRELSRISIAYYLHVSKVMSFCLTAFVLWLYNDTL